MTQWRQFGSEDAAPGAGHHGQELLLFCRCRCGREPARTCVHKEQPRLARTSSPASPAPHFSLVRSTSSFSGRPLGTHPCSHSRPSGPGRPSGPSLPSSFHTNTISSSTTDRYPANPHAKGGREGGREGGQPTHHSPHVLRFARCQPCLGREHRVVSVPRVQHPVPRVQCPMSSVQCPVSNVQCPMSNVPEARGKRQGDPSRSLLTDTRSPSLAPPTSACEAQRLRRAMGRTRAPTRLPLVLQIISADDERDFESLCLPRLCASPQPSGHVVRKPQPDLPLASQHAANHRQGTGHGRQRRAGKAQAKRGSGTKTGAHASRSRAGRHKAAPGPRGGWQNQPFHLAATTR